MLKTLRITLATISLLAMLLLFADFTGATHAWLGWLADIQFVPAIMAANFVVIAALVVITLLFGRIYCSVICPLGILQDLIWSRHKKHKQKYSPAVTWLRYIMLGAFIGALVAGIGTVTALLDPYSTFGVMASNFFAPVYRWGNNLLAYFAERMDSYAFYETEVWLRSVPALVMAVLFLIIIGVLAWRGGRTYCNTICPVGTILGVLSRFSLLKIKVDSSKCNHCGLCARGCKASCIDATSSTIDYTRCVDCMDCIGACKKGAISYSLSLSRKSGYSDIREPEDSKKDNSFDASRRDALAIMGTMVATQALAQVEKTTDGGLAYIEDKKIPERGTPLVPPGAMSIKHMKEKCVQCQLCISACPNGVLRPSTELATFMDPVMSYERGWCRPECTRCADVCPADAIRPITVDEKSSTQIGHARWIKENCVVLTDGVHCGACARRCPAGAIEMIPSDPNDEHSPRTPMVDESRCIGCGACEHHCPARPFSAIIVEGHEIHKKI